MAQNLVQIGDNIYTKVITDGNVNYYLISTYEAAGDKSGVFIPTDKNRLLEKKHVSDTGCQLKPQIDCVLRYDNDNMCVAYVDLIIDEYIMLDGVEDDRKKNIFYYTTTDGNMPDNLTNSDTWYTQSSTYGEIETDIPSNNKVGDSAFTNCTNIKTITTNKIDLYIGDSAFKGCVALESVAINSNLVQSPITIKRKAFSGCTNLKYVTLGNYWYNPLESVTIGANAFEDCTGIIRLQGCDLITNIYASGFKNCSKLKILTLVNCTSIGGYAFSGCTLLNSIILRGNANFINPSTIFTDCPNIKEIILYSDNDTEVPIDYNRVNCPLTLALKTLIEQSNSDNIIVKIPSYTATQERAYRIVLNSISRKFTIETYSEPSAIVLAKYVNNDQTYEGQNMWAAAVAFGWMRYNIRTFTIKDAELVNSVNIYDNDVINNLFNTESGGSTEKYEDYQTENITDFTNFKYFYQITEIEENAFRDCTNLSSITVPSGITSIGDYAFSGCTGLTILEIPSGVTSIGNSAFEDVPIVIYSGSATGSPWGALSIYAILENGLAYDDTGKTQLAKCLDKTLTAVTIPNSVTIIGENAFNGCTGLTSIIIPDNVVDVDSNAFDGCSGLTSITIGSGVTYTGSQVFKECTSLISITIPDSVISIGDELFYDCSGLTSITIGSGASYIGDYTFSGCISLTGITIPDNITSIGSSTFDNCSGLTSITIGSGVTYIGSDAFYYSGSISNKYTVTINATNPPYLDDDAFNLNNLNVIIVPTGYENIYKSAQGWSEYASVITS